MVNVLDLITELHERSITFDVSRHGRYQLVTDAPVGTIDDQLAAAIRAHRDMLIHVAIGRHTHHEPAACTTCGAVSMVAIVTTNGKPRTVWPWCRFNPDCTADRDKPGRHVPRLPTPPGTSTRVDTTTSEQQGLFA